MPNRACRRMTLAVHGCSLCTKPTDGLRDVFCCTSVSRHTRSVCALQCHHTNPLSCKVPKITTLTWSGDAWQGLRVILSLAAHPVHKRRLKICDDIMVGNRKGADRARQRGSPGEKKMRPTECAHKLNQHVGPTLWRRTVRLQSAVPKIPGANGGPETLPARGARGGADSWWQRAVDLLRTGRA